MADNITATVDASGLLEGLRQLGDTALKYTKPASRVTANNIEREAQGRVRRATGDTAKGIQVFEMHNGEGYVVVSNNRRMPNLPLWIEAGIKRGKPRSHDEPASPYFWPAVKLESSPHDRRISQAVADGIRAEGFKP